MNEFKKIIITILITVLITSCIWAGFVIVQGRENSDLRRTNKELSDRLTISTYRTILALEELRGARELIGQAGSIYSGITGTVGGLEDTASGIESNNNSIRGKIREIRERAIFVKERLDSLSGAIGPATE